MKKIVLQAGHVNIKNNSIVSLRGSTGAPNEAGFNKDICEKVKAELESKYKDVQVTITDGCGNDDPKITEVDWHLFLAVHYDADVYNDSGGFVDFADPDSDNATVESQRIAKILSEEYFKYTGIKNMPKRSNANTRFYYMWQYLTAKTPCVLIECGVGMRQPKDYDLIHEKRTTIVSGIVLGLSKALSLLPAENPLETKIEALEAEINELRLSRNDWRTKSKKADEVIERLTLDLTAVAKSLEEAGEKISELNLEIERLKKAIAVNKTPLSEYSLKELLSGVVAKLKGR